MIEETEELNDNDPAVATHGPDTDISLMLSNVAVAETMLAAITSMLSIEVNLMLS